MASLIDKLKRGKLNGDGEAAATSPKIPGEPTLKHPPLAPNGLIALPNSISPVHVSAEGLGCQISYLEDEKVYRVVLVSNKKKVSDEKIDPTDRKKKAVTDFTFKGLIGIHIHPTGMLIALDQEENFRGEPRVNQPPAEILTAEYPAGGKELEGKRFASFNLPDCTEENPLLIGPNHGKFHMLVKPVENEDKVWGLFLSNPKGYVREDSPPVVHLEKNTVTMVDRKFFTKRASSGDGGIDARNWNKAIADPVLMRLTVDGSLKLTIEEMYTSGGLTLLLEDNKPIFLGNLGFKSQNQENAHKKQFADLLVTIRQETKDETHERGMEHSLKGEREQVVAKVAKAIEKRNQDGVSKLAVELAVKEVLAPFYGGESGSDTAMLIDDKTVALLNAVAGEIVGWVEADTTRALAVAAVEKAIEQSGSLLPRDGLEEVMSLELPDVQANPLDGKNSLFGALAGQAKKTFTSKNFIRHIRQISKDIEACDDKDQQQKIVKKLDTLVTKVVAEAFELAIVTIAIKGYLIQTEQDSRQTLGYELKQVIEAPITNHELENMIKRYEGYAAFLGRSYTDRLEKPLDALLQDFQHGANDDNERGITTKPFLTYLIALRSSGGKVSAQTDSAPAASSLQGLPDAIPDILVSQPEPDKAQAVVRLIHREGVLLEAPFILAPRSHEVPEGLSNGLWFAVQDLAKFIMGYYLTGETVHAKDRRQGHAIIHSFTNTILLKVTNLFRDLNKMQTSDSFELADEVIGKSSALLEMIPGANPEDEYLDFRKRPGHISEEPLNIKHALRKIIVDLEKDGTVDMGSYRFKQRVRSFAMSGMGVKGESKALLPIKMLARGGLLLIRSEYNNEVLEKSVRLVKSEDLEGVTTVLHGKENDQFTLAKKTVVTKRLSRAAIYKLIQSLPYFGQFSEYEKTKLSEFDTSFKLYRKGDTILRQESKDIAFFVVIKGHVRSLKRGTDLRKYGPGDMFGEMAFLTNKPQTSTVESLTNLLVLRVDQEMFSKMGPESREKFKDHIIARQVRSLAETTNRMQAKMQSGGNTTRVAEPDPTVKGDSEGAVADIARDKAFAMIDKLAFFAHFSTFEKRRMCAFFTSFRTYQADSDIIREGMTDTSFFLLIHGQVQVIKGDTFIVDFGPGEVFGEMAFLINEARSTTVRSKEEVLVLRLDSEVIDRLGSAIREKIKDQLITKLTERLVQTLGRMKNG